MSLKKTDENGKDRTAGRLTTGTVAAAKASSPVTTTSAGLSSASSAMKGSPKKSPSHEDIAFRAWEIWKSRGCVTGRDLENWLEAERQIRSN